MADDIPRPFRLLQTVWPIAIAIIGVGVSAVRADAKVDEVGRKVEYIWNNGAPPVGQRLARIDERQLVLINATNRIEDKLDQINARGTEYGHQHYGR